MAMGLALGACNSGAPPEPSAPPAPPVNYRDRIAKHLRANFRDPESIRDIGISAPELGYNGLIWGEWAWVCVRANGRNGFGGFTGPQIVAYGFKGDRYQILENPETLCRNAVFGPFPELERALKSPI